MINLFCALLLAFEDKMEKKKKRTMLGDDDLLFHPLHFALCQDHACVRLQDNDMAPDRFGPCRFQP